MDEDKKTGCILSVIGVCVWFYLASQDNNGFGIIVCIAINIVAHYFGYQPYYDKEEKRRAESDYRYEQERPYREQKAREDREERERKQEIARKRAEAIVKVEKISMDATIKHEKTYNRNPVDVSKENRGYDILSSNNTETRHIEVKGLSLESYDSYVLLTTNEYEKAKELCNNYFLYIVSNCESDRQQLYVLKNPASILNIVYNSEANKYKILLNDVKQKVNSEYV